MSGPALTDATSLEDERARVRQSKFAGGRSAGFESAVYGRLLCEEKKNFLLVRHARHGPPVSSRLRKYISNIANRSYSRRPRFEVGERGIKR